VSLLKSQDLLGVFLAVGITVIAVGIAFAGDVPDTKISSAKIISDNDVSPNTQNEIPVSRGSVLSQGTYASGITNPEGESIEFDFVSGDTINLDDSNGFIRAKITYTGYLQQMEKVKLDVISANTGQVVKSSDVFLDLVDDNVWVTDVMHRFDKQEFMDSPELLGTYLLKISTDNGAKTGKATFTVSMPSVKPVEEIKTMKSSVSATASTPKTTETKSVDQQIKVTSDGFDLSSLEPLITEKIGKAYLTKILKEYYAKNISKDDFSHLKSFEDLECSVAFKNTSNGEEINISCSIKQK